MTNALVALSGGLDSTTVFYHAIQQHGLSNVEAITFSYGAKHGAWETKAASRIAFNSKVLQHHLINVAPVFSKFTSRLLYDGGPLPEGHYNDKSMKLTVVPGRNMIFASIMAGLAESRGIRNVYLGIHAGDHTIYPDCRPEFYDAMADAVTRGTDGKILLRAPFLRKTKKDIIALGLELGVPFELTRTCYSQNYIACGKCGACVERLEAFALNGLKDPIEYVETNEVL